MFRFYSSYALVITGFTHLLCCGIPLLLGLSFISTNIFHFQSNVLDFEFLEIFEVYLITLTSIVFLLLISLEVYDKKIKCVKDDDCCTEEQCDTKKNTIRFNIFLSSFLYIVNLSFFIVEKI